MDENVIVVGSLNMDLTVRVPRLPTPGETVSGADAVQGAGGKGANQAVAAARLGGRVRLVGLVGDDGFGNELRHNLRAEGVDERAVGTLPGIATGLALIVVQQDGENAITLAPGANRQLDEAALARLTDGDPARYAAHADVMLLQLEVPVTTVLAAARSARSVGVPTVLNAAPLPPFDQHLRELLGESDVLVVNETEAVALLAGAGLTSEDSWPHRAAALRSLGPDLVVITLGAAGAVAADGEGPLAQPGFPVEAVDTVGAGDSFCAGLALALAARSTPAEALRRACAAGALATVGTGAQAALPTTAEVDHLIASSAN
ncbi:ribokinase [Kitasatospora sp. GP82]|uniref:ribokinase n=1 Tax=Kitasatospora sp. GP82 TaxID=3035089 RepID=UPI00247550CF|nr:ribokinase [Kitasatospora sp. GP82]